MYKLKRSIALIIATVIAVTGLFTACSSTTTSDSESITETLSTGGLESAGDEYVLGSEEVTDENGETVTDKDGNAVTEEYQYKLVTNANGDSYYVKQDTDGNEITDNKGNVVTSKVTVTTTDSSAGTTKKKKDESTTASTTAKPGEASTEAELTTIKESDDSVPKTSATGKTVTFSSEDQQTIKNMLEVPYLYLESYENSDGVPTSIAAHAAIWMADRENLNTTTYASGTIVLDLFKYFSQTVVNFKTKCNSGKGNADITYNSSKDTFTIPDTSESQTHTVSITKIESVGNNNYYKVTATVSGTSEAKKVVAIVQKNLLDSSLGFSIKALKWTK